MVLLITFCEFSSNHIAHSRKNLKILYSEKLDILIIKLLCSHHIAHFLTISKQIDKNCIPVKVVELHVLFIFYDQMPCHCIYN